jgi:hypothetical protein
MRSFFFTAALLAAGCLSAQTVFLHGAAPGFEVTQHDVAPPPPSSFSLPGGAAWDPAGPDFYFYDAEAEAIRRFDTALGAPAAPLFQVPNLVFGPYLDSFVIDPMQPSDFYAAESGAGVIHKIRRAGPDTLDAGFGNNGVQTGGPYSFSPYDVKFDPFGRLFVIGANFSPAESGVYLLDRATLSATMVVDLSGPGGAPYSGPIAFDSAGNLFVSLPPLTFNPNDTMRIARFSKARLDTVISSAGAQALSMADGTIVVDTGDGFPVANSMSFRNEGGEDVLYFAGTHTADVYRSVPGSRGYTVFAFSAPPPTDHYLYIAGLAIESPDAPFRPYSGDASRMLVVMVERDPMFTVLSHGLCVIKAEGAPQGVDGLELTDTPSVIANGSPFRVQVELRDSAGMPINVNGGVKASILSGSGTLSGTTYRIAGGGTAIFDDLVLDGASGSVILQFQLAGTAVVADSGSITVAGSGAGSGDKRSSESSSGCSTGRGGGIALLGLLVALRLRRARRGVNAR